MKRTRDNLTSPKQNFTQSKAALGKLQQLLDHDAATSTGIKIDPFADFATDFVGQPSGKDERIVTNVLTQSYQITAPATSTTSNWSAVVFTTPFDIAHYLYCGTGLEGGQAAVDVAGTDYSVPGRGYHMCKNGTLVLGPVTVWIWDNDVDNFFPNAVDGAAGPFVTPNKQHAEDVLLENTSSVRYRVASTAFQLHNTTSPLNRSGTITTVRASQNRMTYDNLIAGLSNTSASGPNSVFTGSSILSAPMSSVFGSPFTMYQSPPPTLDAAMTNGGVQRKAEDGAYCVCKIDPEISEFTGAGPSVYGMDTNGLTNTAPTSAVINPNQCSAVLTGNIAAWSTVPTDANAVNIAGPATYTQHFTERDMVAVYLTGLSRQSTFTLTVKHVVELAPRVFDEGYQFAVPMLRQQPAFSDDYLEVSSKIQRSFPSSVPVSQQENGEFWKHVMANAKLRGTQTGNIANTVAQRAAKILEDRGFPRVENRAPITKPQRAAAATEKKHAGNKGKNKRELKADSAQAR